MAELTLKIPSWKRALLYALGGIGGIVTLLFLSGFLYGLISGGAQDTNPSSQIPNRGFATQQEFSENYQNAGIQIHYTDDISSSKVNNLAELFQENNVSEVGAYVWEGTNNRVNLAYHTIYESSSEIPYQSDLSNQASANLYSSRIFNDRTLVLTLLDRSGQDTLKTYISN